MLRCFFHSKSGRSSWCNLQPQVTVPRLLMVSGSCTCRRKAVTNHCRVRQAAHFPCDTAYRTGLALRAARGRRSELLSGPGLPLHRAAPACRPLAPSPPPAALHHQFSRSVVSDSLRPPVNRSTPGLPVHHQLPEFTQTHVHRISDAIQPSHPLASPSPPAPNPSQHQSLFQ